MKGLALLLLVCMLLVPMCAQAARLFNSDPEEFKWQLADHLETYIEWTYGGNSEGLDIYYGIGDQQPLFMILMEYRGMCGVNVTEYIPMHDNQSTINHLMNVVDVVVNTVDMHYYHSDITASTVDALLRQTLYPVARDGNLSQYYDTPGEYTYSAMGMDFYQNIFYSQEDNMYVYSLSIFPW